MESIISVKDLSVSILLNSVKTPVIQDVSFNLYPGETLAIVGESGSGKSVTAKSIIRLLEKNIQVDSGEVLFDNRNLLTVKEKEMRNIRGKDIAMIFQDPMTSLNPSVKIGYQIMESILNHQAISKRKAIEQAIELLKQVGIPNAGERFYQYPHQFSGGQRQRIGIAIALACDPKVLIADEPTTALDSTIQLQILELLKRLRKERDMAMIFITHDLGVVSNIADDVAVMYAGRIVEYGKVEEVFYHPQHPYTWGLLGSIPNFDQKKERLYTIPGTPPKLGDVIKGDPFAPRNEFALKIDAEQEPPAHYITESHYARTWLLDEDAPSIVRPKEILRRYKIYDEWVNTDKELAK